MLRTAGITQAELAEKCGVGEPTVSRWGSDDPDIHINVSVPMMRQIASAGVNPLDLFGIHVAQNDTGKVATNRSKADASHVSDHMRDAAEMAKLDPSGGGNWKDKESEIDEPITPPVPMPT